MAHVNIGLHSMVLADLRCVSHNGAFLEEGRFDAAMNLSKRASANVEKSPTEASRVKSFRRLRMRGRQMRRFSLITLT